MISKAAILQRGLKCPLPMGAIMQADLLAVPPNSPEFSPVETYRLCVVVLTQASRRQGFMEKYRPLAYILVRKRVDSPAREAFGGPLQWQVDFTIKAGPGFKQQGGDILWTVRYECEGDRVETQFPQTVYCL